MSQAVENRSRVVLEPLAEPAAGPDPGWMRCRVVVSQAADVEGYPNLLAGDLPREMEALIPTDEAAALTAGVGPHERLASLVGPRTLRVFPQEPG